MDKVFIRNLQVDTVIGIYDFERNMRQTVVLDIEMAKDISIPASSENIDDALDYKKLSDQLVEFIQGSNFLLIETLAERIANIIREDFNVQWVKLTLHKPGALSGDTDVGVIIERGSLA